MGAEITGDLKIMAPPSDAAVLQQFEKLPKLFAGQQVTIEFVNAGGFRSAFAEECTPLGLEIGASVCARVQVSTGAPFSIYGDRDVALALCKLPQQARVRARATTAFGVYKRVDWTEDGPIAIPEGETGLMIKEIIHAAPDREETA